MGRVRTASTIMPEFNLHRTGKVPIKFSGDLIAHADGQEIKSDWDQRYWEIHLYRTAKNKRLVAQVAYRANPKYRKEPPFDQVEVFDDPKELEKFLMQYDPTSCVLGFPPKPQYEEMQRQEMVKTRNHWGTLVSQVLTQAGFVENLD